MNFPLLIEMALINKIIFVSFHDVKGMVSCRCFVHLVPAPGCLLSVFWRIKINSFPTQFEFDSMKYFNENLQFQ